MLNSLSAHAKRYRRRCAPAAAAWAALLLCTHPWRRVDAHVLHAGAEAEFYVPLEACDYFEMQVWGRFDPLHTSGVQGGPLTCAPASCSCACWPAAG